MEHMGFHLSLGEWTLQTPTVALMELSKCKSRPVPSGCLSGLCNPKYIPYNAIVASIFVSILPR